MSAAQGLDPEGGEAMDTPSLVVNEIFGPT